MGTTQSYGNDPTNKARIVDSDPQCKIYASEDEQQYQKYIVTHDGSQKFQNNYQFRIENRHNDFVDVLYIGPVQSFMGCAERSKYEVVTQRIPYKLSSLTSIKPKNSLVILKTALRGFRALYRKHGPIGIKQSMIGINSNKKVKVWLNQNYALNNIEDINASFEGINQIEQEREMVHCIFDLICSKTDSDDLWIDLLRLRQSTNPKSFDQALNMVDYFAGKHRIVIQEKVINLFNKMTFQTETPSHLTHSILPQHQTPIQPYLKNSSEANIFFHFSQRQQRQKVQGRHITQINTAAIPQQSLQSNFFFQNRPKLHEINTIVSDNRTPIPQPLQPILISGIPTIRPISSTAQSNGIKINEGKPNLIKIKFNNPQQTRIFKPQFAQIPIINASIDNKTSKTQNLVQYFPSQPQNPMQSVQIVHSVQQIQKDPILIRDDKQQKQIVDQINICTQPPQIFCEDNKLVIEQGQTKQFLEANYQIQVHEVSSVQSPRQSIHQQLSPLIQSQSQQVIIQQEKQIRFTKDTSPLIFEKQQQNIVQKSIQAQDNFRTIVNPQLVDTRQIKQTLIQQRYENNYSQRLKSNLSYKQMRKWLQQELRN